MDAFFTGGKMCASVLLHFHIKQGLIKQGLITGTVKLLAKHYFIVIDSFIINFYVL